MDNIGIESSLRQIAARAWIDRTNESISRMAKDLTDPHETVSAKVEAVMNWIIRSTTSETSIPADSDDVVIAAATACLAVGIPCRIAGARFSHSWTCWLQYRDEDKWVTVDPPMQQPDEWIIVDCPPAPDAEKVVVNRKVTVKAFLDSVEFVRKEPSSGSLAEAFLCLADDADGHKFKVAVPRAFAKQAADYLADFDDSESGESPTIELTFEISESKS